MPAFRHKPLVVDAVRDTGTGRWTVKRGDMGYLIDDAIFRQCYEPIGKEGRMMMLAEIDNGKFVAFDPDEPVILPFVSRLQSVGLVPDIPQPA